MTTKTFDTLAVFSAHSGVLLGKFDDMHELIEFVLKRPVFTHELASKQVWADIRTALERALPGMLDDYEQPPAKDDFDPEDTDLFKGALAFYCDRLVNLWGECTTINDENLTETDSHFADPEILSRIGADHRKAPEPEETEARSSVSLDSDTAVELARFLRQQATRNLNPTVHNDFHKFADLIDPVAPVRARLRVALSDTDLNDDDINAINEIVWSEVNSLSIVRPAGSGSMLIRYDDLKHIFGKDRRKA